jgi:hypothetical protein
MKHKFHLHGEIQVQAGVLRELLTEPTPEEVLEIRAAMRAAIESYEEKTGCVPTVDQLIWEWGIIIGSNPRDITDELKRRRS